MVQQDEDIQYSKGSRGYGKEVDTHQAGRVILQKGAPCLGGWFIRPHHVPGHGLFGHGVSHQLQFRLNSGRSPSRIFAGHLSDEIADLFIERRSASLPSCRAPTPEKSEALSMPADHRVRLDYHQTGTPVFP